MIVLVIVLWLTNGDVVSRHDVVPSNVICEAAAAHIEEQMMKVENVEFARARCFYKGQPV